MPTSPQLHCFASQLPFDATVTELPVDSAGMPLNDAHPQFDAYLEWLAPDADEDGEIAYEAMLDRDAAIQTEIDRNCGFAE